MGSHFYSFTDIQEENLNEKIQMKGWLELDMRVYEWCYTRPYMLKKNIKKKSRKSLKKVQTLSLISSLEEDDKKHLGMEEWYC